MKITNKQIIDYCKRENKFQETVYARKIQAKTMSKENANRNYLIIQKLGEIAALCEKKGMTLDDVTTMLEGLNDQRKNKQSKISFPN